MNRRELLRAATATGVGVAGLGRGAGASTRRDSPEPAAGAGRLRAMDGSGTDGDPYLVTDVQDLQAMAEEPDARYVLGNDVDASATAGWNGGAGFAPIEEFTGTLDGQGHAITGLTIARPEETAGLFAGFEWGTVRDLALVDVDVEGRSYTGALVGYSAAVTITGVDVSGSVRGTEVVGGLVGDLDAKTGEPAGSTLTDCTGDCDVRGVEDVGGLIGTVSGSDAASTEVARCAVTVTVEGEHGVGGLVGTADSTFDGGRSVTISACRAGGTVTAGDDPRTEFGGLVGVLDDCTVRDSRSSVTLECGDASAVGGLVGEVRDPEARVLGSEATGDVQGSGTVGGLGGQVVYGAIRESGATGDVTGTNRVGGVAGELREGEISDTYAYGDVSGEQSVGGVVGILRKEFGDATVVERTVAAGTLESRTGAGTTGGVTGNLENATTVAACYWDADVGPDHGIPTSDPPVPDENGVPAADLTGATAESTLAEFDFQEVWLSRSDAYPTLQALTDDEAGSGCPIVRDSVAFDPYPVPAGTRPDVSVVVDGADAVRLRGTYEGEDGDVVDVERSLAAVDESPAAGTRWETSEPLPGIDGVGTWVDLTVEAETDGETCSVEERENGLLDESTGLGYYTFDHVMDAVVVLGRFDGQTPGTTTDPDRMAAWLEARMLDANRFYGSGRGAMGAVGFDLSLAMDGDDFYEIESPRADFEDFFPIREDPVVFLDELRDAAADVDYDAYDFWIGVHAGEKVGGPDSGPALTTKGSGMYASRLLDNPWEDAAWAHEFGHVYGLVHTYDRGNDTDLGVMANSERHDVPVPFTAPYTAPLRVADTLALTTDFLAQQSEHRRDWLTPTAWPSEGDEFEAAEIPALQQYGYEDEVPILTFDGPVVENVHFLVESRPFLRQRPGSDWLDPEWDPGYGAAVVYRREAPAVGTGSLSVVETHGDPTAWGILEEPGDSVTDKVGLIDPVEVTFELADIGDGSATPDAFSTRVSVERGRPAAGTRTVAVSGRVELPESFDRSVLADGASVTPPSLDLHAEDAQGRRVGHTDEGTYVTEIPGARAAGRRVRGMEWITVPADADVEFTVSSADVEQYIQDLRAAGHVLPDDEAERADDRLTESEFRRELTVAYDASETRYGDDPELTVADGEAWVDGATVRADRDEIDPGADATPEPDNEDGALELVSIDHDGGRDEEAVTFANGGTDPLEVGGWTVEADGEATYSVPDGTTVESGDRLTLHTRPGTDAGTDLYWGADGEVWPDDGGEVTVTDGDGETRLAVVYDERGVVYYDPRLVAASAADGLLPDLPDVPGWLLALAGAGAVSAGFVYLMVRMLAEDDA